MNSFIRHRRHMLCGCMAAVALFATAYAQNGQDAAAENGVQLQPQPSAPAPPAPQSEEAQPDDEQPAAPQPDAAQPAAPAPATPQPPAAGPAAPVAGAPGCANEGCCPTGDDYAGGKSAGASDDCVPTVHKGKSETTVDFGWLKACNFFDDDDEEDAECVQADGKGACCPTKGRADDKGACCPTAGQAAGGQCAAQGKPRGAGGCTGGAACDPSDGHACCVNRTGSCADGSCTCQGCQDGTGCLCCGTGRYAHGCQCGTGCKCGSGLHKDGVLGDMFGTRGKDCRCGSGCRCGGRHFVADLDGDGKPDRVGKGRCRHCGRHGLLYGHGFCGICCGLAGGGIPVPGFLGYGIPVPGFVANALGGGGMYGNGMYGNGMYGNGMYGNGMYGNGMYGNGRFGDGIHGNGRFGNGRHSCFASGRDGALGGHYSRVYAVNPYHHDFRDGAVYAAQGYNAPISVPLAPNVDHQWNYGWGIPSSRLTPVSRVVPSPYAAQPTYQTPQGYYPVGGQPILSPETNGEVEDAESEAEQEESQS